MGGQEASSVLRVLPAAREAGCADGGRGGGRRAGPRPRLGDARAWRQGSARGPGGGAQPSPGGGGRPRGPTLPGGLVVRIRRSHRRGPGSIPGQGSPSSSSPQRGPRPPRFYPKPITRSLPSQRPRHARGTTHPLSTAARKPATMPSFSPPLARSSLLPFSSFSFPRLPSFASLRSRSPSAPSSSGHDRLDTPLAIRHHLARASPRVGPWQAYGLPPGQSSACVAPPPRPLPPRGRGGARGEG